MAIDSGFAACALPVGVASTIGMQELNGTPQECIAAAWVRTQVSEW